MSDAMPQAAFQIAHDTDFSQENEDAGSELIGTIKAKIETRDYGGQFWEDVNRCVNEHPAAFCAFVRNDLDPLRYVSKDLVAPALRAITAMATINPEMGLETFKRLCEQMPHAVKDEVLEAPMHTWRQPIDALMEHTPYATSSYLSAQWGRCHSNANYGFHHRESVRRLCDYAGVPRPAAA